MMGATDPQVAVKLPRSMDFCFWNPVDERFFIPFNVNPVTVEDLIHSGERA